MPLFTWIGKEKIVNHDKDVPFRLLKKIKKLSLGERSEDLIVEGDNLEALKRAKREKKIQTNFKT